MPRLLDQTQSVARVTFECEQCGPIKSARCWKCETLLGLSRVEIIYSADELREYKEHQRASGTACACIVCCLIRRPSRGGHPRGRQ
jgi:hypothetical protein